MKSKSLTPYLLAFITMMLATVGRADSVFTVSSSPALAVESGITELAGAFTLTLLSGTTEPATVQVFLSPTVTITNTPATGIQLTATDDLAAAQITAVSNSPGYLLLSIPGGASSGSVTVSGLRVDLSNGPVRSVRAFFSVSGSTHLTFTTSSISLVNGSFPGLVVDAASDLSFRGGIDYRIKPVLTFTVREGFSQAFTSAIGRFGQNNSTQIKILVRNLIEGIRLTFPAVVTANESNATLQTLTGSEVALTAGEGENSVFYRFTADPAGSDAIIESFTLKIQVRGIGRLENGATAIQASLAPVGASADALATEAPIPRYRPLLTPPLENTGIPYEQLFIPAAKVTSAVDTGITFSNPLRTDIRVTFLALTPAGSPLAGPGVNNPVTKSIPEHGQLAVFAAALFNLPPDFDGAFSIKATAEFEGAFALLSFFTTRELGIQGGIPASLEPRREFILPKVTTDPAQSTSLSLFNPNDRSAAVTLELISRQGETLDMASVAIPARGTYTVDTRDLFNPALPAGGGYVYGRADQGVVSSETFGQGAALGGLIGQSTDMYYGSELYVSHFVQGDGFYSEITLINRADVPLDIAVKALDDTGHLLRLPEMGENPATIRVAAHGQYVARMDELFRWTGDRLIVGQLEFEVRTFRGFYPLNFSMAGALVIGNDRQKILAALPLVIPPARQLFFAHVIEAPGLFTGIALLNSSGHSDAEVVLTIYSPDGSSVGFKRFILRPHERIARLVRELVPEAYGLRGGMIRVRSDGYVQGYSLVGSERLDFLSASPPQRKD
ncbi:MAG: hypothetical protein HYR55_07665 [Acidobacteria bacterium]|nr:hypothetical protein [Acidobacteriota bacterium]MBI3656587.1 hypothetical protein [Acidobacteriota bacterium]